LEAHNTGIAFFWIKKALTAVHTGNPGGIAGDDVDQRVFLHVCGFESTNGPGWTPSTLISLLHHLNVLSLSG
jgi:hypothetical protein